MPHLEIALCGCPTKQEVFHMQNGGTNNLLNKDNYLMTSVQKSFSKNHQTPSM
jgi:hypothetical protein